MRGFFSIWGRVSACEFEGDIFQFLESKQTVRVDMTSWHLSGCSWSIPHIETTCDWVDENYSSGKGKDEDGNGKTPVSKTIVSESIWSNYSSNAMK